jgi:hypothetical protein
MLRIGQLEQENNVLRTMVQQLQSRVSFQEIQLQSLQTRPQLPSNASTATNNVIERRPQTGSECGSTQMPFSNQMNMIMNSY